MPCRVGGCLSLHWSIWRDKGAEPWVVEVLRKGYLIPSSSLSGFGSQLFPEFCQGECLTPGDSLSQREGSSRASSPLPGIYSRLFVVWKALGSWRPVIDLSNLNRFVLQTRFKMETAQSEFHAVQRGYWMVPIDLKDVYLQTPVHPNSR